MTVELLGHIGDCYILVIGVAVLHAEPMTEEVCHGCMVAYTVRLYSCMLCVHACMVVCLYVMPACG